ncbi:MAG: hypothetical protein IKX62_05690 [Bacteroidales bacterium]|nr:hypothetical protein [Bacteroidales bacterium]
MATPTQVMSDFMLIVNLFYDFRKNWHYLCLSIVYNKVNNDMKNQTQRSIKRLSIATLIIGGLTLAYIYWEMIAQLWVSSYIYPLTWNPDIKGWQIFILIARFIGVTSLFILCCIFLYRTNKGLKDGEIFPKSNIPIIRWAALVAALLAFVHSNYSAVVKGESELMVDSNTILIPLIVLLFAGLYKMAYHTAKDSSLSI